MLGFEVKINDEKVCVAGFAKFSVLTTVVSWVSNREPNNGPESTTVHVGGLAADGSDELSTGSSET